MAKVSSLINFSGSFAGMTFVRSKRYGNHVRAKRGSKTYAGINDAFVSSQKLLMEANRYAKLIKDSLECYRGIQRDGTLWSRLVKFFRKGLEQSSVVDLHTLRSFRISTMRLSSAMPFTTTQFSRDGVLQVSVAHGMPTFSRIPKASHYLLDVIAIFVKADHSFLAGEHTSVTCALDRMQHSIMHDCSLPIPAGAYMAIVVLKCQAIQEKFLVANQYGMGMEIVGVVEC